MHTADETTTFSVRGRTVPLEIFRPQGQGPWPGVLVIHEIFGLNDDIRRICRRFAEAGYLAAAPDLMAAGAWIGCVMRAMTAMRSGDGETVEELEAAIRHLGSRNDVGKVGAAGFCLGGGFALLLGTRQRVQASAVYYGETVRRDQLARACPLVGGYGGKDRIFGPKGRRLIRDLDGLGVEHDVRIYEDAGHSYMSDAGHPLLAWLGRPLMHVEYNAEAAEDSWRRMLAFFGKHLQGQGQGQGQG